MRPTGSRFGARCLAVATLCAAFLIGCGPPPISTTTPLPDAVMLHVETRGQEASQWCWAASGEMMMAYFGVEVHQCQQATDWGGHNCPCNACRGGQLVGSNPCDFGTFPNFHRYNFAAHERDGALSWTELRQQLAVRRAPVGFSWLSVGGGGGHMMVATGYAATATSNLVSIVNPLPYCQGDTSLIDYEIYDEVPGEYTHWKDFYDLALDP